MRYLLVGTHPDDIEIGAGAVLLKLLRERKARVHYVVLTLCTDIVRNHNIVEEFGNVMSFLEEEAESKTKFTYSSHNYTNRDLASDHMAIRKVLEDIREQFKPDVIFSTSPNDVHQDHAYIGEEVLRVFRYNTVLSYEVPRSSIKFSPVMYVEVSERDMFDAISMIELYKSQENMDYMDSDVLYSMFMHRGNENGVEYAQAFEVQRISL